MKLTKQEFNQQVEQNKIDIRPDDTAYINGVKYKILPVSVDDTHVELKECVCESCNSRDADLVNEPYQEDVNDKIVKVMLCKDCYIEAVQEI